MKRYLLGYVPVILLSAGLFNFLFSGTVTEIQGKVDVLIQDKWQPAQVNMEIKENTKIMTGVNSSLKVETDGGFFLVKELSMVTYNESQSANATDHKIEIDVGKVKVRFAKAEGIKSTFKVQTPKGTASVRGTEEDVVYYPVSGMKVEVVEGIIDVGNNAGHSFSASRGESAGIKSDGKMIAEVDLAKENLGTLDKFTDKDTKNVIIQDVIGSLIKNYQINVTKNLPVLPEKL